jgi:hypothetical protein
MKIPQEAKERRPHLCRGAFPPSRIRTDIPASLISSPPLRMMENKSAGIDRTPRSWQAKSCIQRTSALKLREIKLNATICRMIILATIKPGISRCPMVSCALLLMQSLNLAARAVGDRAGSELWQIDSMIAWAWSGAGLLGTRFRSNVADTKCFSSPKSRTCCSNCLHPSPCMSIAWLGSPKPDGNGSSFTRP